MYDHARGQDAGKTFVFVQNIRNQGCGLSFIQTRLAVAPLMMRQRGTLESEGFDFI